MKPIWITNAQYVRDYVITVCFSDGKQKVIDLKDHLCGEIFEPIKEVETFKNFTLSDWTIQWDNGADISPEYLYAL
ncbi:MAG: DUF2442 domain-containing protein [Rikenellaceae bacterium]